MMRKKSYTIWTRERREEPSLTFLKVDESTAFGRSYLILYLRGDVTGEGETENIFLDLIELEEGTTADAIYKALKKSLLEADLDDAYLKSHLICITTDGASVMTGRQSGLITRLKKDYPLLESIHCLAHRLELSVSDALKSVTGCNHFEIFISKLYTLHHQSPKNARQLSEAASQR
ncbi:E3 SUMO-protein ligase KIAA1586-like [Carassius carassius]|uniref:E3 SUMO-protein ligase KIAA1586-like n=1 Tax=Carassius carassius TaxID=217509 RepID=UPI0028691A7C|nr:E3 SUMO-protein ligase KIAA1586-like [Carassius carassius]